MWRGSCVFGYVPGKWVEGYGTVGAGCDGGD